MSFAEIPHPNDANRNQGAQIFRFARWLTESSNPSWKSLQAYFGLFFTHVRLKNPRCSGWEQSESVRIALQSKNMLIKAGFWWEVDHPAVLHFSLSWPLSLLERRSEVQMHLGLMSCSSLGTQRGQRSACLVNQEEYTVYFVDTVLLK